MPFEMPRRRPPAVRVEPSAATELSWLMVACGHREAVISLPAELVEAADSFWDDGLGIQPEIMVMADGLGCLSGWDIAPMLDLEHQRLASGTALRLSTEDEDTRRAVRQRVERLRSSPALRGDLGDLLRRTWAHAAPSIERLGRPTVERSVSRLRAALDHGVAPIDIFPEGHIARRGDFLGMTQAALDGEGVLITPCYAAGVSGHVLDLPATFAVAIGTGVTPDTAALRSDAERVAAGLKLLADSTRLMILSLLDQTAAGVGDIAKQVGVAQPTASVHVRQLREAGLLTTERDGTVVRYRTNTERLQEVLGLAQQTLVPGR